MLNRFGDHDLGPYYRLRPDEQETREAAIAAVDALSAELEAKGVPVKEGSWGYRLLVVDDPDGNQLFFNYPNETASGKIVRQDC
jgi:hypothetical protein